MQLNISDVITAKRREKSWTQEQLACAVGVSAPAVSKWETGVTYPDITLLSPIARALETTVDELLSYRNELSADDVTHFTKKASDIYKSEGFDPGWDYCQELLREYPNSIPLKYYLGSLFQSFLLFKPDMDREKIQKYYRGAADIYEEVLLRGAPEFTYHATLILVGYYTALNELDRAEELLDSLPKTKVDPDLLYPSIYAIRGRNEDAIKMIQDNIRRYVSQISQELTLLCAFAREREDMDAADALAKTNFEMTKLFAIREHAAYPDMIKVLIERGNKAYALDYLEEYTQSIIELDYDYSKNPVFDRLANEPEDTSYIKKILAQSILMDKEYAPLEDDRRYTQTTDKLRWIVQA